MLSKMSRILCLIACFLALGHAINPSKTISKAIKRVKRITETRGRGLSNEQECAAIGNSLFFLTGSGQPYFTHLCGSCMDALEDIFTQLHNKGCLDDDECDFEELEHEGVCVEDCSTDSSVCDTDDTCQNGKCLPADGSDPEEEDSEAIITIFQYACVTHPDGAYCYDKATFFFQGGGMSDCSDFDGVGCCYGWLKKLVGCFEPDDEWAQSTDEDDPYLTACPYVGISTTPCSGTPDTCAASGLTISFLLSLSSLLLFILNQ